MSLSARILTSAELLLMCPLDFTSFCFSYQVTNEYIKNLLSLPLLLFVEYSLTTTQYFDLIFCTSDTLSYLLGSSFFRLIRHLYVQCIYTAHFPVLFLFGTCYSFFRTVDFIFRTSDFTIICTLMHKTFTLHPVWIHSIPSINILQISSSVP